MSELDVRRLRPQTQTVSVYTRHSSSCSKAGEPQWRRCKCTKYLYLLKDGTRRTVSAKTRSWEKAEAKAQEIRDAWDPVKQKLAELERQQQAQLAEDMVIEVAIERWLKSVWADIDHKYTRKKYETVGKKILSWARLRGFTNLHEVTTDALDGWKTEWRPKAKRPDDRMGKTTAGRHLERVKAFFMSPDEPVDQHPEDPQSWNLYNYVRNNPLSSIDQDGNYDCGQMTQINALSSGTTWRQHKPNSRRLKRMGRSLMPNSSRVAMLSVRMGL